MRAFRIFLAIAASVTLPLTALAAEKKTASALTNSLPSDPELAWKEIETASKPPPVPADWGAKPPTPEQRASFSQFLGEQSARVAAKAKEFYTRFPEHQNTGEARKREQRFLQQAVSLGNVAVVDEASANLTDEQKLQQKVNALNQRALQKRAGGSMAVWKEMEAGLRELIKEHPDRTELWQQMYTIASSYVDKEEKKRLLNEIVRAKGPDEETIARAKGLLKSVGAVGNPLELAFTALDGRLVDVQKMKGKVVLIDFWAAWCGPCITSLPELVALHEKLKDQGLEIVGINMDRQQRDMEQVVGRFRMPWPQYFDGKRWGNKFALEYGVSSIPSMWLVDKKGILRTMEAREDLEQKITKLLEEKD